VKNQRVDLSPEMFQQVQQLTRKDFTKFVSSKGVLHCSDFHSLDQMSFHDLTGHHSSRVLEEAHDSPYSGHLGKHKVLHQIKQNFWWPGWRKDVESYVFGCLVCQRNKAQTVKKAGLLQRGFLYRALSGKV
jgi:hypothetical protein